MAWPTTLAATLEELARYTKALKHSPNNEFTAVVQNQIDRLLDHYNNLKAANEPPRRKPR